MRRSPSAKSSPLLDTRVIYCGDNLEQLRKVPQACVDLIYIDPPFNSNRNYEVFWGETKEKRAFEDRHASTQAYIEFMRPRCVELARVLKKAGSFYYHCDWHASHYVKVMLDQIFGVEVVLGHTSVLLIQETKMAVGVDHCGNDCLACEVDVDGTCPSLHFIVSPDRREPAILHNEDGVFDGGFSVAQDEPRAFKDGEPRSRSLLQSGARSKP